MPMANLYAKDCRFRSDGGRGVVPPQRGGEA